jgi:hypothetical protein
MSKKQKEDIEKTKKMLSYSLSDSDIKSVLGDSTKIIKYADLDNYKSLNALLPYNNDFIVILIESEHNSGHWTCITRRDNIFSLFDSYGCKLSDELDYISKTMNYLLGNTKKEMENLIKNTADDCEVVYNKERLQSKSTAVATCGKWVSAYLSMFKMGYDLLEFLQFINKKCKESGLPPDVIVNQLLPIYK